MRTRSAASACRVSFFAASVLIWLFGASPGAAAETRTVHVGQGGTKFVDEISGTSTSNIHTSDTIPWVWSAGPPPLYCPTNANSRGQMAVFLTKTFSLQ